MVEVSNDWNVGAAGAPATAHLLVGQLMAVANLKLDRRVWQILFFQRSSNLLTVDLEQTICFH